MLTIEDIRDAASRIDGVANHTPVLTSRQLDRRIGGRVFIKAENHQRVGAFKFRGAYNRISRLGRQELDRGIVTVSSGNHAQAVALASQLVGARATVLMPIDAPAVKRGAVRSYGAGVVDFDRYAQDRDKVVAEYIASHGGTFVPPYDHPQIMAGQGTVALELIESTGDLDALIVPVSGGGLMAGCGVAARALCPNIRLVGAEPAAADDTKRSLEAGKRVRVTAPRTIADGLQVEIPGELTFEINRRQIDEVVLVSDDEIIDAMRIAFETLKTVAEPSGAASLAALLSGRIDTRGKRVGVVLSGGNISASRFAELVLR